MHPDDMLAQILSKFDSHLGAPPERSIVRILKESQVSI